MRPLGAAWLLVIECQKSASGFSRIRRRQTAGKTTGLETKGVYLGLESEYVRLGFSINI